MSRSLLTLTIGLVLMLALGSFVGCSDNNPIASNASANAVTAPAATLASTEIYGRVGTIDPAARTMTLEGNATPIVVEDFAEVVRKSDNETPIELSEIVPGDSAEVRGVMSSGTLFADRVRIRVDDDNGGANEVEVSGRVSGVDPAARTISLRRNDLVITVMATAEIVRKSSGVELPIQLSDIQVMDSIDIRGTMQPDGSLLADRVRVRIGGESFGADIEFKGSIIAIDYAAGTFQVTTRGETITTDANTQIFAKRKDTRNGQPGSMHGGDDDIEDEFDDVMVPIEFADLSMGDTVEVYANIVDANTLYAVAIELEDGAIEHAMEVEFKDVLASIDPVSGTVTFQNQTWTGTVLPGAELAGLNNEPLTLGDFSAGELVEVKGFKTGDQTFDIVRMHKDNN